MKEKEFINTIKTVLNSEYIGDDCAYLADLGIVITQDNLIEGVHFKQDLISPYQLGWKSAMVNISDVCASGAEPKYLTVGLSLPQNINKDFVEEFYKGMKDAGSGVKIVGGDITGADKIFVSVATIGRTSGRRISSRKNAKVGQKIIVAGLHGSSSAGLRLLMNGQKEPEKFIKAHLTPLAQVEFSRGIAENIKEDYAMMDTSDGLADALSQIAEASGVNIEIDFSEILYDKDLERFEDYKDLILFGGEDYGLVASVNDDIAKDFTVIGEVKKGSGVTVLYQNGLRKKFSKTDVENRIFNHF